MWSCRAGHWGLAIRTREHIPIINVFFTLAGTASESAYSTTVILTGLSILTSCTSLSRRCNLTIWSRESIDTQTYAFQCVILLSLPNSTIKTGFILKSNLTCSQILAVATIVDCNSILIFQTLTSTAAPSSYGCTLVLTWLSILSGSTSRNYLAIGSTISCSACT